ncbi:MAG: flavodoxin family protein [Candidatus Omnitrophica bacterium]|nr:flavodoxin family protein [Candidatus Omnitrophota bacterium]
MVKILGVSGSPRRYGNTETILDAALMGAALKGVITEKVIVSELCIKPCLSCDKCLNTAVCVIKDDMRAVYRKFKEADGVIMASPVYFGSLTAQLKTAIDRFEPQWIARYCLKKRAGEKKRRAGIFLCVSCRNEIKFFRNAGSIVRSLFATLGIKYLGGIFCGGVTRPGDITKKRSVLKRAFAMGAKLAGSLR